MSDIPEDGFPETAWRFALLLTGCYEGTSKVFKESVDELLRHPHPGDLECTKQLLFTIIRRRVLSFRAMRAGGNGGQATGWCLAVAPWPCYI
jgi:hypothetical protein